MKLSCQEVITKQRAQYISPCTVILR